MRDSLVTMKSRPIATPDSSTRMRSAATSVKPCELSCPCLIGSSPAQKTLLITIAKCHIAGADRSRQIEVLGSGPAAEHALSHNHDVDLLYEVGRIANAERIGLVGFETWT